MAENSQALAWKASEVEPGKGVVEVLGLKPEWIQKIQGGSWTRENWQKLLAVFVRQEDLRSTIELPPVVGKYSLQGDLVQFEPRFPLQPGTKYTAVFRPSALGENGIGKPLTIHFEIPAVKREPTAVVRQVYPSAERLPANLLKFYVHFSAPMSGGGIYEFIELREENGEPVELPFLEINEELWDREMTRLTLLFDPGRIKRGVKPLEEVGPALKEGKSYTLKIKSDWPDANGVPLKAGFEKNFVVGPPDREPLDHRKWKVTPPNRATKEPLRIEFEEPLDHALARRVIELQDVSGQALEGSIQLGKEERSWIFTPQTAWKAGEHIISVQTLIEDLAGNNIGKPFEVDLFEGIKRHRESASVQLRFEIR